MSDCWIFLTGLKHYDFIVFNPLHISIPDSDMEMQEILLDENIFWGRIKSLAWSSSCRFFFVLNKENIVIGNTLNNNAFLATLSIRVFQYFIDAAYERKVKNVANKSELCREFPNPLASL